MNALDVLKYGHGTVLEAVDGLAEEHWHTPNVCGVWSVKEIISHLASFEYLLEDVLNSLLEGGATPVLDAYARDPLAFNDNEVDRRQDLGWEEALAEYKEMQACTQGLAERIPADLWTKKGALAWYGEEYDLEDLIAYSFYGHKREHCAQINVFRDQLKKVKPAVGEEQA
jgi:uncharacterized damage-inducible protein DinB